MTERFAFGEPTPEVVAVVVDIDAMRAPEAAGETLGAYTRRAFSDWLRAHPKAAAELRTAVARENGGAADTESVVATAYAWIEDKRQEPALEAVLGAFWAEAYATGALDNALAEDAVAALAEWAEDRRALFVFSVRPRVAQRALLTRSDHGDLSALFAGLFDTRMGQPDDAESFTAIATALGELPATILYIATRLEPLDAAAAAGWQTCRLARGGAADDVSAGESAHPVVDSFAAIELI